MKDKVYSTANKALMELKNIGIDIKNAPIRIFLSNDEYIDIVKSRNGWAVRKIEYSTVNKALTVLKNSGVDIENAPIRVFLPSDGYIDITKISNGWVMDESRTYVDDKGYPHVKPIKLGFIKVFIVCPYCKTIHNHGRGDIERAYNFGHRVSHCYADNVSELKDKGYIID